MTTIASALLAAAVIIAAPAPADAQVRVPWNVGEKLSYDVRFGSIKVGNGLMEVQGIENVRGHDAYHIYFSVQGGVPFYKVDNRLHSWMDVQTLNSLRHVQDYEQGGRDRERHWEIFPDRAVYQLQGEEEKPSVSQPLDDGSFLYFVRTVPLVTGRTYTFNRYFRPDRNPVRVRVLRRETVKVPAGTFETVVVQPIIKTSGIFSEGGQAEIWLTDDDRRMMVQMKSKLSFGSLNLYLTGVEGVD
jgi:hypothetical protein